MTISAKSRSLKNDGTGALIEILTAQASVLAAANQCVTDGASLGSTTAGDTELLTTAEAGLRGMSTEATVAAILAALATLPAGTNLLGKVNTIPTAPPNYDNNQVATGVAAGLLLAARATRRSVVIKNIDDTDDIFIGKAVVSLTNGYRLKPGQSERFYLRTDIFAIASANTPRASYLEEYD